VSSTTGDLTKVPAGAADDPAPGKQTAPSRRAAWRPSRWVPLLLGILAFVPRALTTGHFQTTDEVLWTRRSIGFTDAVLGLDPASASATTDAIATMPGVTTMWLGSLARGVWTVGGAVGIVQDDEFLHSSAGILLSQLAMAVATSLLLALFVALAWRWAGPVPAVVAGVLLATEPFVVAHSAVLHTDALTAFFGASGAVALFLALRRAPLARRRGVLMAAVAGALLAGAFLSKLSALVLAPGLALVVAATMAEQVRVALRRREPLGPVAVPLLVVTGVAAAAALLTVVLTWPAIWADTRHQVEMLRQSSSLADMGHRQFFLGRISEDSGPLYYFVTTPMRMTPWFLVGAALFVPLALTRRWRAHLAALAAVTIPAVAVLATTPKQFDRYILVVVPFLALAVGMGVDVAVRALRDRLDHRVPAVVAAVVLGAHAAVQAPWGIQYFNPLLGGIEAAERTMLIGWGEGLGEAGSVIEEREAPHCDIEVALIYHLIQSAFPCGTTVTTPTEADYLVLYISERQRMTDDELAATRQRGRLIDVVRREGIVLAEIYDLRLAPTPADEAAGVRGGR
jgi:hypothetical protein